MIFIDWLVAAAVRLHYELKTQVRPLRRTSEPIKWSPTNRPILRVQLGEQLATACHPVLDSLCLSLSPFVLWVLLMRLSAVSQHNRPPVFTSLAFISKFKTEKD